MHLPSLCFYVLALASLGLSAASATPTETLLRWNRLAVDASGLDHTPVGPGETRVFGEQLGPCRASRAMAITHIAMYDTMMSVSGRYRPFNTVTAPSGPVSVPAAIAKAARDTLASLFPSQADAFDAALAEDLAAIPDGPEEANGLTLGQSAAAAILVLKAGDGSTHAEPLLGIDFLTSIEPGHWRQDPVSLVPIALGAKWTDCIPFVLSSTSQFRAPAPPALGSPEYADAYEEVKRLGGDGITTPTERTADETETGIYWAYDGTPSLCAPPRLYNQIATQIALQMGTGGDELARLLTIVNVAMADAGIAVWDSKYHHDFWRPVTGIREADPGTGPTGAGDGNAGTVGDPLFLPLGAPASNLTGPNFTPPFPAYPSGHAGFGAALFESLRRFYGTDDIAFTFVSDEYNGVTRDNLGNVRPLVPRSFSRLSMAEEENGQSRIYLGIHWSFDKTAGIEQGRQVAHYVFTRAFLPYPALAISAADGTASLSWQSASGENYQIESSDSLDEESWSPLHAPLIGNGEELSVTDTPPATGRFYRLKYWRS